MPTSPFSALAHYRILPAISSGPAMVLAVIARAPIAMVPLGTLTAITASTGSVATGGLATALVAIAIATASPLIGRWADRRGQRFVLTLLTPIHALALFTLLLAALGGWDGPALWAACLAVGLSTVPVGSFTRARWIQMTTKPRDLATAFSYESTVDETTFVLGPALVGIAASAAAPSAPLGLAAALVVLAGIPFALTAPRADDGGAAGGSKPADGVGTAGSTTADGGGTGGLPEQADDGGTARAAGAARAEGSAGRASGLTPGSTAPLQRPSIPATMWAVVPSLIVMACIGMFFGSVQAGTTERAALLEVPGQAGLVYALMGLTSAAMALLTVLVPERVSLPARFLAGGVGMAAFIAFTLTQASMGMTAWGLLITGIFIGPTMVTAFSLADRRTPPGGTAVAMTSMQSSVTIGVSAGSAVGGVLAAWAGPEGGFAIGMLASVIVAVTGAALLLAARRRR